MPFSGGFSFDGYDQATGAVLLKGPFGVIHKLSPNWANSVFEIKTTNWPNNNKTAASLHPSNSNNNNDNSVGINENKDDDEEEKEEEDTYTESSCSESYVSSASTYLGENGDDDEKEEEKEEEIKNVKLTSSIENGTSSSPQWPVHGTVLLLKSTREMRKQNGDNKHLSNIDMTSEKKKEEEKISTTQKENKEEDMAGLLYEVPLGETSQCETAVLLGYNESGNVYLLLSPNVCTGRPPTLLRLSSAAELLEYYTVRNSNSSESKSKLATETSNCLPLSEEDEEECMVRPELDVSALYDVFDVNVKNVYYLSSWSTAVQFVGVAWGIPWVTKIHKTHSAAHTNSVDSAVDVCVEPLPHCYSAHLLCELYGVREVKGQTETNSVAPSPHSHLVSVSRRLPPPPPPPFFVRGNKVVCRGSLGTTLECDLLPSFLSPFGVVHGERLIGVSKTAYASCKGIILGVHMGCPVLLLDGMPIATVLRGVHSAKELSELFITLRDAPENATGNCISVLPQAQNGEKGHVALSTSISEETKVNSETPVVLATGTTVRNIENKTENTVQIKETFPNSNETISTETPREDRHESRRASGPPLKPLHNVRVELRQYLDAQVEPPPPPPPSAAAHVCADKTEENTFIPMTREANGASSDDIHIKPYENIENKTAHTLQLECEAPDSGNCTLPNQQHAMPTSFTTPSPFFTTFLKAVAHWRMHELSEEAQRLDPLGFVRFYEVDSLHRVMGAVDILKRHGDVFSAARQSANVASLVNLLLEHEGRPPPRC